MMNENERASLQSAWAMFALGGLNLNEANIVDSDDIATISYLPLNPIREQWILTKFCEFFGWRKYDIGPRKDSVVRFVHLIRR
jgi:hypothetical protein